MKEEIKLDRRRCATKKQRREIYDRAGGRCEVMIKDDGEPAAVNEPGKRCERALGVRWVAGHFPVLWTHGGATKLHNLRGECCDCAKAVGGRENAIAKRVNRMKRFHEEGRATKRTGPKMVSRGFDRRWRKKLDGTVEKRIP